MMPNDWPSSPDALCTQYWGATRLHTLAGKRICICIGGFEGPLYAIKTSEAKLHSPIPSSLFN
jgi:hypothetical protein